MLLNIVLEKTLESPMDCKEIKPVHPKGNQSWISIGRTDAEAEAPILWPLDSKTWLTGKEPDAEKDWRREEKGMTEDEMFRWRHWLNGHEFEQAPGVGDGQGSLALPLDREVMASLTQWPWVWASPRSWWWTGKPDSCSPLGPKESDMTEGLNWLTDSMPSVLPYHWFPQMPEQKNASEFSQFPNQWQTKHSYSNLCSLECNV